MSSTGSLCEAAIRMRLTVVSNSSVGVGANPCRELVEPTDAFRPVWVSAAGAFDMGLIVMVGASGSPTARSTSAAAALSLLAGSIGSSSDTTAAATRCFRLMISRCTRTFGANGAVRGRESDA